MIFGAPDPSDTGGLFDLDEGAPEVANTALYFPHTSMDDFNETKFIYGNTDAQTTALFNYLVINDTLIEDILKFFGSEAVPSPDLVRTDQRSWIIHGDHSRAACWHAYCGRYYRVHQECSTFLFLFKHI